MMKTSFQQRKAKNCKCRNVKEQLENDDQFFSRRNIPVDILIKEEETHKTKET